MYFQDDDDKDLDTLAGDEDADETDDDNEDAEEELGEDNWGTGDEDNKDDSAKDE